MPGISPEALAGYILEELLAYLLRNAGYRLLTDETQDPHDLANRHHGLVIRGRGAEHQVDVLGELLWIPAFTFPIRLVLEAKCRNGKTDISAVRGMVAALLDINQNNMPNRPVAGRPYIPRAKYAYVGAIFSASGFSSPAADFALAHGVSLVDLQAPELRTLVTSARTCAVKLNELYGRQDQRSPSRFVRAVRDRLRVSLETALTQGELVPTEPSIPANDVESAVDAARRTDELFIGMASGPYMLVLKADDPRRFLSFAAEQPTHEIEIRWSRSHGDGQTWTIVPRFNKDEYRLSFKLPERLAAWIFTAEKVRRTALTAKEMFFGSITIYRHQEQQDQLIRLTYDPRTVESPSG